MRSSAAHPLQHKTKQKKKNLFQLSTEIIEEQKNVS